MLDRQTCRELGVPQYVKLPIPAYAIQILPENYDLLRREERLDLDQMQVKTLEGVFHYEPGDYLVVGNSDEVWTVPPPLRWRGTLGQPKAGGLFLISRNFGLTAGAPCGILEV